MAPKNVEKQAEDELTRLRARVEQLENQLQDAEVRLKEMGIADPITGLYSYRYFLGRITEEVARADRFNLEVSCLLLTLDKPGFEGLLEVAKMMKDSCRMYDIPARWGQNELVMLMPATDLDGAQTFAERFRLAVESAFSQHAGVPGLTVSIGLATYPLPGLEDAQQLLEAADSALHKAVSEGGNRTMLRT
jgi:diguanylate cyclase (GGDEF)-like protein